MLGLLAHGFHLLLVVFGLVGVAVLLLPQVQAAARSSRRTTFRPPANQSEHEQRVAELRAAVAGGRLTTPDQAALRSRSRQARDAATWRAIAVASSMAAAGVHAAVFPHHLEESYVVGIAFLAMTLGQAAWACLVTIDASKDRLLVAGIVGNLGLVALWAVSRTTGLPFGLGREAVGGWDIAAVTWELVLVVGCLLGLRHRRAERALVMGDLGRTAWTWVLLSVLVLLVLTLTVSHH
jgi:hypothetical protein